MYFLAFDFGILFSLNLIFYIILGFAVLAGFLSGLKKSLYKLITMAIFYIVFFATINVAVNILWNANLSFLGQYLGQIDSSLAGFTSFADSYESILQLMVGEQVDLSALSLEAFELIMGILIFAVKIIWTILYFTVILIAYKILTFIIRIIFFKTKKGANKMRGFGAIVGAANGLMAIFIVLIVMGGFISITNSLVVLMSEIDFENIGGDQENLNFVPRDEIYQANYSLIVPVSDETLDFEDFDIADGIEVMKAMVEEYNSNLFVRLANAIEVKSIIDEDVLVPMHINLFDTILSFDYNDKTIAFRYELSIFSEAALIFAESDYMDTQNLTDIKGDEIRDIFAVLANSKLVVALVPIAIEIAALEAEIELPIEVETLYDGTYDFEEEIATIGRIGGALFDVLNGAAYIGGEGSLEEIEITGETVRELFGDIAGSEVILLITEVLLFPMLEDPEGDFSMIITIPEGLDLEAEIIALGEIFATIVDSEISFEELMSDDITVTLSAISKVDLTILLNSKLVTEALINILSGTAGIEGLEFLSIPSNIVWRDVDGVDGELRKILSAFNALLDAAEDIDFNNIGIGDVTKLDSGTIDAFFDSYVIRATITDMLKEMDMSEMPLVFPDVIYDALGYFTKEELVAVVEAAKLIIDPEAEESDFDPMKILQLSDTEIDTLFVSNILYATVGNYFNEMDTDSVIVPDSVNTTILVDGIAKPVVTVIELKNLFKALIVLDIQNFEGLGVDASMINKLQNSTEDDIDAAKVTTLLNSEIIHATFSDVIVQLDKSEGGALIVTERDVLNNLVITEVGGITFVSEAEILSLIRAMYFLDVNDFDVVDLENTQVLKDNFDVLLDSAIIHATISDTILTIGSTVIVPEKDVDNNDVIVTRGTTVFILEAELSSLLDGLDLLGVSDPTAFNQFNFGNLDDDAKRTQLLESAILHATITDQLLGLDPSLLYVPVQNELGEPLKVQTGTLITTFVIKDEIKAIITAMIAMGYSDVNDLSQEIQEQTFIDNMNLVLQSASMQATVSNKILNSSITSLRIPDQDEASLDLRIVYSDVTFIRSDELENFFISVDLFDIPNVDFDTFYVGPDEIMNIDTNIFFNSFIMVATVSDYFLDVAGDETEAPGTTILLIPTTKRIPITIAGISAEVVERQELINILNGFDILGYSNYGEPMDANIITSLTGPDIDNILLSDSLHVTIDNMLRGNAAISGGIPALAEDTTSYSMTITIKTAVRNFILATQQVAGADFTNVTFDIGTVTSLSPEQRDIVLDSMIVRNILTDQLEAMMLADPDPYWPADSDYMNNDPLTFLTEDGINNVFTHYGLI